MTRRAAVALPAPANDSQPLRIAGGTLEALKWLALLLMTIDHANKYLAGGTIAPMFAAGRVAMPLFVFALAYNAARPGFFDSGAARRTCTRLALYGVAASVPFIGLGTLLGGWWPLNIMFTLLACIGMLWAIQSKNPKAGWALVAVFSIGGALVEYWWPALLFAVASWHYVRQPTPQRLAVFVLALAGLAFVNLNFWALAALPLILAAPRVQLAVPRARGFFYAYYPAHLAALWLIVHYR